MAIGTREKIARTRRANRTAEALRRFQGGGTVDVTTSNGNRTVSNNRGTITVTRAGQNTLRYSPNGTRRIKRGQFGQKQPSGGSGGNSPITGTYTPAS